MNRREFNGRLARVGMGLAATSLLPSFTTKALKHYPTGKYVDMHHHFGKLISPDSNEFSVDPIIEWMDKNSVSQTVIMGAVETPKAYYIGRGWPDMEQDYILEKFQASNGRLLAFAAVHPEAYDSPREISRVLKGLMKKGIVGFGELKPRDRDWNAANLPVDDPSMKRIYAACGDVGLPVLFHIDERHAVDEPGLPRLEKMLKEYPDVNFIGHANGWWNCITGDVKELKGYPKGKVTPGGAVPRLLDKYPNIYGDLSANSGLNAVTRDPEFGRQFLHDHADKLLFGTDAQGGNGRESHFEYFNALELPEELKDKIFRDNTRKLLNI